MASTKNIQPFRDRTGKRWFNHSVIALMRERARDDEMPQETIRRLAREVVAEAKNDGWTEIPFDAELLAELRGIEVKCAEGNINAEARLMPLPDRRLQIEYAPEAPETRRRFSICHEIVHTFFPDCFTQIQHRRNNKHFDPVHAELEQLCHLGAGELLMPYEEFAFRVAGRSPSMMVAAELAQYFNASHEAALRRMVDLSSGGNCLLWLSERLKPAEEKIVGLEFDFGFAGPKLKLRVDYQFPSPSWHTFVPKHKSIPDGSVPYMVLNGEECQPRKEDWSSLKLGTVHLEAVTSLHAEPDARGIMLLLSSDAMCPLGPFPI